MKVNKYIYKEFFFILLYKQKFKFRKIYICHSDIIFLFQKINSKVVFFIIVYYEKGNICIFEVFEFSFLIFFPLYNWNWNPIFFKILFFLECCCFEMRKYKFIFKKWFVPNIIFFWNIFWCFFPHASPSKTRPTDKQHRNRKTLNKTHKHAVAREDLQFFFAAALSVTFAGVQLSAVCAGDVLGIPHSALSFRFVLHWLSHGKQLPWCC